jgi:hypothetical protein
MPENLEKYNFIVVKYPGTDTAENLNRKGRGGRNGAGGVGITRRIAGVVYHRRLQSSIK